VIWAAVANGYVSTDGANTWKPLGPGLPGRGDFQPGVKDFAVDPLHPDVLYAATQRGVFRSTDGGATGFNVLRSGDGGQSWRSLDVPWPGWDSNLAVDPITPTRVYFGGMKEGVPCVRISEDEGESWHEVTLTLPVTFANWSGWTSVVAPSPGDHGHILAGLTLVPPHEGSWLGGVYVSDDYGEHWQYIDVGRPISLVTEIVYDPLDPAVVYAGIDGSGLLKSSDGGITWQHLSSWPGPGIITAIALHPSHSGEIFVVWSPLLHKRAVKRGGK